MTTFVLFGLAGVGTFALRVAIILGEHRGLAGRVQRNVSLISPAILGAFVASAIVVPGGEVAAPNPVVIVAILAGGYGVHRTGNVAAAMAIGLPIYWLAALMGLT